MRKGRYVPPKAPSGPPETVADAAEVIRKHVIKVFSRTDGEAVNWPMMANALFKVAFYCLDRTADPERRASMLRRLEVALYDRMAGNEPDAWDNSEPSPDAPEAGPRMRPDGPRLRPNDPSRKHSRH